MLLRRYRVAAGITQEELAERARLSRRSITAMERGTAHTPRRDTLDLLATALALAAHERTDFLEAGRGRDPSGPSGQGEPAGTEGAPPFVGRSGELALVERHLAGEGPPLLLLAGEPGIGKSRLLHAAIPRAAGVGLRVLEGGCRPRGGQPPYAPFLLAFQRHLRSQRPARLREELRGCAWLVRLLPELAGGPIEPLPANPVPPEHERRLVFAAATRFLTNLAGPAGTLLILDDLQWAGPDSLDLLAALTRAAHETPLRLIGAYRDTEAPPEGPLAATLTEVTNARLATRRLLSPLSPPEAARLLDELLAGDLPEPALRAQVLQRASGVPFFLVSCAQGLRQDPEDGSPEAVPWDVAQSVRQRITVLPETARQVLGIAAVIGRHARYDLLRTVAARPEQEVVDALDAACQAQLLAEEGDAAYRFCHDVIREVVEADLGAARRMLLHRDIARGLQARTGPPPVEELAYHLTRGDQPEQALPYLARAAGRARVAAAYQEEAGLLAQAIELAQRVGRADLLGDLHARRAAVLSHMTHWVEAREEMQAALALVPPERGELRAEILIEMAKASNWGFSDAASIRRYANEALSLAEGFGREDLAIAALSVQVIADSADGQLHAGIARYHRAAARAAGRHAGSLAPGAQFASLMHYWLADFDQAILLAREAIALGREAYDTSTVARAQGDLGCSLMGSGRYAEALHVFTEGQHESREQGAIDWLARSTLMRGGLHLDVFDFGGAEALAQEARELSHSARYFRHPLVSGGIDLLLNFARRGDLGRAEGLVDEVAMGVANARGAHGWLWNLRFVQAQAEIALARGNHEHALQFAEEVIARSRTLGRVKYEVAGLQVRAQALAMRGHTREALGHLRSAVARARGTGDPAMFLRAAAALLAIDGEAALVAEAHAAVERIAGALPDAEIRLRFLAAEPVRLIMRLPG
ncbi:MAG TPA: AAA family ATPase [Chloroflexota bacterium]|jgi:transcriptional regulator with XRE-family HTH domain/tetratricopeptide (TPR) repeat protein